MPDPATGIFSAIQIGGTLLAREGQQEATEAASEASAERLAFDRQRYEDWKATYGPIEENLAEYYSNLSPETYAAQGLEAFQEERQRLDTQLRENLAQRGLTGSAVEASLEQQADLEAAEGRARIRAEAPIRTAQARQSFLQFGLPQDPSNIISQGLAQREQIQQQQAFQASQNFGQALQTTVRDVGTAALDYFRQDQPVPYSGPEGVIYE